MLRAVTVGRAPQLLAASGAAVSHTGNLTETALATVSIPAGAMGLNGGLLIYATWSMTNSANSKTPRIRLGGLSGTIVSGAGHTAAATFHDIRRVRNRNSASSQVFSFAAGSAAVIGPTTGALSTGAVDTSAAQDLVFSAQLANAGETLTLENYEVWLLP